MAPVRAFAGDDKAPIAAILNVLKALARETSRPTSNLIFLFDGEEEAGSPHLGEYLTRYRDRVTRSTSGYSSMAPCIRAADRRSRSVFAARWAWK